MRHAFAALCAVLSCITFCACGNTPSTHIAPRASTGFVLPESARTPDGARPEAPPATVGAPAGAKSIDRAGLELIEGFEGYSRCAYWDSYGGVWTAGYGQTRGISRGFCFRNQAAAEANLRSSVVREYEWAVDQLGPRVTHDQGAVDGLDSFAYNLGAGIFTGTLRADLERGQFNAACSIMRGYDHAGGVVLPGLYKRRVEECAEILKPVPKPVSRRDLLARQRTLRRVLLADGCDARRGHHQKLGPTCRRWFVEGATIGRELRK